MTERADLQARISNASTPGVPLETILCTDEMLRRPKRPPDHQNENIALTALGKALSESPRTILQTLAEEVLKTLDADSAGLSLLTKDGKRFYWAAIAGAWRPHVGGGTPRDFGPCGDVLDVGRPMLFTHWERRYAYLRAAKPLAEEGLLVPFHVNGEAVGTIWAIAHRINRKFDAEDQRVLESMGLFASAAYQTVESLNKLEAEILARQRAEKELRGLTESLEKQVLARTRELERGNAELRRSRALLAEAQRLSATGSFSWRTVTSGITDITGSDELYRIFELDRESPVTLELLRMRVHPDDIVQFDHAINRARTAGEDIDCEYRLRMPDRSVKYLHVVVHRTADKDGQPEYVGAAQDVTWRRLSEKALAQARANLARGTAVASLGLMTASISHEVKQPLAAIVTNAQASLRWLARDDPDIERARLLNKRIVADALLATEVVDAMRGMASRRMPEQMSLSFNDVVSESLSFLERERQLEGISVMLDLPAELPLVMGDRTLLQQVIVNLLMNAVQALAPTAEEQRSISVKAMSPAPDIVRCVIEDSGPGIDPGHLPFFFENFFTTKDTGMGLGLAICRAIVEAHGGRIRADNDSDLGGARFSFELRTRPTQ